MRTGLSIFHRARQRTFYTKAVAVNASQDCLRPKTRFFSPSPRDHRLAVIRNQPIAARILRLCTSISPSHIARFVVSIHVNTIKGMLGRWSPSNIIKQFIQIGETKFDATSTVIRKSGVIGISTAAFSGFKRKIFSAAMPSGCLAVCRGSSDCDFTAPTSTRLRVAASQIPGVYDQREVAQTSAHPRMAVASLICIADDSQASKDLPIQIGQSAGAVRKGDILNFRHFASNIGDLFRVGMSASIARPTRFIIHDFVVV